MSGSSIVRRSASAGTRHRAELLYHPHHVGRVPMLHELTVAQAEDVDLADRIAFAGSWHAHELTHLRRTRREADHDAVAFGNRVLDHELRVGEAFGHAFDRR